MPNLSIYFGLLLVAIGVLGYAYSLTTGPGSFTALIPAAFGAVLAILGFAAVRNEGPRKHLMHGAVIIAFVGFAAMLGRLISKRDGFTGSAGDIATAATAFICLIFVVLTVRSFIAARKSITN